MALITYELFMKAGVRTNVLILGIPVRFRNAFDCVAKYRPRHSLDHAFRHASKPFRLQ